MSPTSPHPNRQRRLSLSLRASLYALRGGFLIRPLAIALFLGSVGAMLSELEEAFPIIAAWVPHALFPSRADPQVAQVILSGIATSIMTVVSIVFAMLLMTLTLASMQFSPRILVSFARDGTTQWTLGIFLGTFSYCMAALPAARTLPVPFSPVATVVGAMVLALICVSLLIFFINHIAQAISVNHIVDRIARETERVIDELMPHPRVRHLRNSQAVSELEAPVITVAAVSSGYIRFIDTRRLVSIAKQGRLQVRVLRRVGHFSPAEAPLLEVGRASHVTEENLSSLLAAIDTGPTRTFQQDVEFGIIQIVDIALKAISPAVNDPSTAITCVDHIGRIIIRWIGRESPDSELYSPPHTLRATVPWIDLDELLDTAFEQIRHYAESDLTVSLRLLRMLQDVAMTTRNPLIHDLLLARADRLMVGCKARMDDDEIGRLDQRLSQLRSALLPKG